MFALREHLEIELTDKSLCAERWTRRYYYKHQRIFNVDDVEPPMSKTVTTAISSKRILSQQERYRKAVPLTTNLTALASEVTGPLYLQRIELLAYIQSEWQANREVFVHRPHIAETSVTKASGRIDTESLPNELLCAASTSTAQSTLNLRPNDALHDQPSSRKRVRAQMESSDENEAQEEQLCVHLESSSHAEEVLNKIIVPPAMKRRGRPEALTKLPLACQRNPAKPPTLNSKRSPGREKKKKLQLC